MTTTINLDVPLPAGAAWADIWEGAEPERVIVGPKRRVTNSDVRVWVTAIQQADGRIAQQPEPPYVWIDGLSQRQGY